MVPFLCEMTINCVSFVNRFRYCANRLTFESSNAASISSSKQNGDGFRLWIANNSAIAVSDFSPPESCIMFCNFFPGGCAMIRIPVSNRLVSSTSSSAPRPPPNSSLKTLSNITWISLNFVLNCSCMDTFNFSITSNRFFSARTISSCCPFKNSYRSDTSL